MAQDAIPGGSPDNPIRIAPTVRGDTYPRLLPYDRESNGSEATKVLWFSYSPPVSGDYNFWVEPPFSSASNILAPTVYKTAAEEETITELTPASSASFSTRVDGLVAGQTYLIKVIGSGDSSFLDEFGFPLVGIHHGPAPRPEVSLPSERNVFLADTQLHSNSSETRYRFRAPVEGTYEVQFIHSVISDTYFAIALQRENGQDDSDSHPADDLKSHLSHGPEEDEQSLVYFEKDGSRSFSSSKISSNSYDLVQGEEVIIGVFNHPKSAVLPTNYHISITHRSGDSNTLDVNESRTIALDSSESRRDLDLDLNPVEGGDYHLEIQVYASSTETDLVLDSEHREIGGSGILQVLEMTGYFDGAASFQSFRFPFSSRGSEADAYGNLSGDLGYSFREPFGVSDAGLLLNVTLRSGSGSSTPDGHLNKASLSFGSDEGQTKEERFQTLRTHLREAVRQAPTSPAANLLDALAELSLIYQSSAVRQKLQALEVTLSGDSWDEVSIEGPNKNAETGLPAFQGNPMFADVLSLTETDLLPALKSLQDRLDQLPSDPDALSTFYYADRQIRVDRADILVIQSAIESICAFHDLLSSFDLNLPLKLVIDLETTGELNLDNIDNLSNTLLSLRDPDALERFSERVLQSNERLFEAIGIIQSRPSRIDHLFTFSPPESYYTSPANFTNSQVNNFVRGLKDARRLASEPVQVGETIVDFSAFAAADKGLRELLPQRKGEHFVPFTAPDPTFGGLLPETNQPEFDQILESADLLLKLASYSQQVEEILNSIMDGTRDFPLHGINLHPEGDYDLDGVPNLLEYVFSRDLTDKNDSGKLPTVGHRMEGGVEVLTLSYTRPVGMEDVRYLIATSNDLETWDYSESLIETDPITLPSGDGVSEIVTVKVKASADQSAARYLRVHPVAQ